MKEKNIIRSLLHDSSHKIIDMNDIGHFCNHDYFHLNNGYDFYLNHENDKATICIFLRLNGVDKEIGYSFEVKNKKVIWKHLLNAEALFPEDLKKYIEKWVSIRVKN